MNKKRKAVGTDPAALARRAKALHRKATIVDSEGVAVILPNSHIEIESSGKGYVERARTAGLTALNTTMGQGGIAAGIDDLRAFLNTVYGYLAYFDMHADKLMLIETADDIRRAKRRKKLGVIFGVQGIVSKIESDLTLLRIVHKLGLRVAMLTHNDRNAIGCGCMEINDTGITQFGRACIREMQRVGITVDLAHAGERTMIDAFELSSVPCIVSHANVRGLVDHPRNATDRALKALAKTGGVIGITAYAPFIRPRKKGDKGRPTVDNVVDHVVYAADLVGIDHVGIGSDHFEAELPIRYEAFATWFPGSQAGYRREEVNTVGFERVDDWPLLTEALLRRGFSDGEALKVLGGNHLRVFAASWKT